VGHVQGQVYSANATGSLSAVLGASETPPGTGSRRLSAECVEAYGQEFGSCLQPPDYPISSSEQGGRGGEDL